MQNETFRPNKEHPLTDKTPCDVTKRKMFVSCDRRVPANLRKRWQIRQQREAALQQRLDYDAFPAEYSLPSADHSARTAKIIDTAIV